MTPKNEINNGSSSLAGLIDHTQLKPDATPDKIEQLCAEALQYRFASVCVNPTNVSQCAKLLKDSPVKVCTVIGFPLGANITLVKVFEAMSAIAEGATEVDMVINIGALKSGNRALVKSDIESVVAASHKAGVITKVIIETVLLTDEEKVTACLLAKDAGADFVKTSTGFSGGGANVHDIELMRKTVGQKMGVKASGGVHGLEDARALVEAGATRIGASAGVKIVQAELGKLPDSIEPANKGY